MIAIPGNVRVWLATGHTDMRRGFPSLARLVQESLKRDPRAGDHDGLESVIAIGWNTHPPRRLHTFEAPPRPFATALPFRTKLVGTRTCGGPAREIDPENRRWRCPFSNDFD